MRARGAVRRAGLARISSGHFLTPRTLSSSAKRRFARRRTKQKWRKIAKIARGALANEHFRSASMEETDKIEELIQSVPAEIFQHTHVKVTGIDIGFLTNEKKSSLETTLLNEPVSLNMLVSDCHIPGLNNLPTQKRGAFLTPVHLNISAERMRGIVAAKGFAESLAAAIPMAGEEGREAGGKGHPRVKEVRRARLQHINVHRRSF